MTFKARPHRIAEFGSLNGVYGPLSGKFSPYNFVLRQQNGSINVHQSDCLHCSPNPTRFHQFYLPGVHWAISTSISYSSSLSIVSHTIAAMSQSPRSLSTESSCDPALRCSSCHQSFEYIYDAWDHADTAHGNPRIAVELFDEIAQEWTGTVSRSWQHGEPPKSPLIKHGCDGCKWSFMDHARLTIHQARDCRDSAAYLYNYQSRCWVKTTGTWRQGYPAEDPEHVFGCGSCGATFTSLTRLTEHRTASPECVGQDVYICSNSIWKVLKRSPSELKAPNDPYFDD
jgi:hypothetical protein